MRMSNKIEHRPGRGCCERVRLNRSMKLCEMFMYKETRVSPGYES